MNKKEVSTTRWLNKVRNDMENYPRDPNVYVKNEFVPFNKYGSENWPTFYFRSKGGAKKKPKVKYYESYGRTEEEAKKGLEKSIGREVEAVSKQVWSKNKRR